VTRAVGEQDDLAALEERLGVRFRDRELLARALTHHSAAPTSAPGDAYDRLEFLGDALIGAQVVEHLFRTYPDAAEGELTALKSEVVSRRVFARIGLALGLMPYIRVDVASLRTFNERSRESLCADVLEAIVAAIHLDQGRAAADAFVARTILPEIPAVRASMGETNPKGTLQQLTLRQTGELPRYELLAERGAQNDRRYVVGVYVGERLLAQGEGASIKEAGRAAARAALRGYDGNSAPLGAG
jgi:ribonuclease-3